PGLASDLPLRRGPDGRIAEGLRRGLLGERSTGVPRRQEGATAASRERGREENDVGAEGAQPRQEPVDELAHVHVVGVYLVHDNGLAREAEEPQEEVARVEHA